MGIAPLNHILRGTDQIMRCPTKQKGQSLDWPLCSPPYPLLAIAGERELRRLMRGPLRPALGDGLLAGVEADAVRAVGVQVAEQRALPAAEAVVAHPHRQRPADAHHADLDLVAEQARRFTVAGE